MGSRATEDVEASIVSFQEQIAGRLGFLNRVLTTPAAIVAYRLLQSTEEFYRQFTLVPFDTAAGTADDALIAQHIRIGTRDRRIAAIALSRKLIVVTRNIRDFGRVPGLVTEDWTI